MYALTHFWFSFKILKTTIVNFFRKIAHDILVNIISLNVNNVYDVLINLW